MFDCILELITSKTIAITLKNTPSHGNGQISTLFVNGKAWNNSEYHGDGICENFNNLDRTYINKVKIFNPNKFNIELDKYFRNLTENLWDFKENFDTQKGTNDPEKKFVAKIIINGEDFEKMKCNDRKIVVQKWGKNHPEHFAVDYHFIIDISQYKNQLTCEPL